MKQTFTILFLALFTPVFLFAQSNFKKGFVVTTAGDTLRGFIDQQEWIRNPHTISFKPDVEAGKQEFTPENARLFEVEGMDKYRQFRLRISTDPTSLGSIAQNIDTSTVKANIFLKEEQKGRHIAIYSYRDEVKTRFFLQEVINDEPKELIFRRYLDVRKNQLGTSKIYLGQLLLLALKYQPGSNLRKEIEGTAYKLSAIMHIASKINGYSTKEYQNISQSTPKSRFFVGFGLNKTTIDIRGEHNLAQGNTKYYPSYLPKFSVGADAFINPHVQRLILRAELSFTNAKGQITKRYADSFFRREYTQNLDQQTISLTPQIIYNIYNGQGFKFYVGGGLAANLSSYYNINYESKTWLGTNSNPSSNLKREDNIDLDKIWYNFPARAGIILANKIDLSASYFVNTSLTKYVKYSYTSEAIHLQASYLIKKRTKK